ncbi:MAG: low molecular weight protein arginine phosphatase [Gemmatimonadaceae bacterium]
MQLLFVCTGNTCRSPLAEVIAARLLAERGITDIAVGSAGISAWPDAAASDGSLLVALEHGLDLSGHRARQLSPQLASTSDWILTMGAQHKEQAELLGGAGRSWLLSAFAEGEATGRPVSDPFGGDLDVYRATYAELQTLITRAIDRLLLERAAAER